MTVLIAGNSHVGCMLQALRVEPDQPHPKFRATRVRPRVWEVVGTEMFFTGINRSVLGPAILGDVADDRLAFADAGVTAEIQRWTSRPDVSSQDPWGLCTVANTGRMIFRDPELWAHYAPTRWARDGRHPLTDDVLRSLIAHDQGRFRRLFDALLDRGIPVFAISGPPMRRNHHLATFGLPLDCLRHIDQLARAVWRDWLASRGVSLVEPPPESADADGFLLPDFQYLRRDGEPDRHHANAAYGALMVQRVATHAASLRESATMVPASVKMSV